MLFLKRHKYKGTTWEGLRMDKEKSNPEASEKKKVDLTVFKTVQKPFQLSSAEKEYIRKMILSDRESDKEKVVVGGKIF